MLLPLGILFAYLLHRKMPLAGAFRVIFYLPSIVSIVVLTMLFSFVFFRQLYLFFGTKLIDSVIFVGLGYPAGWLVCSLGMMIHYYRGKWEKWYTNKETANKEAAEIAD